jgi:excisionase family DNA binding protein
VNGTQEAAEGQAPEQLHRVETIAKRFDVGRTSVYALIRSGQLRSLKVNGSRRVPESAIAEFIARQSA